MIWLKRALSLVLLGVVIYLFWPLLKELRAAGSLFRQANWIWLGIAVLIQIVSYAFLTWLNQLVLKPFPGRIEFLKLAGLLTSMAFIEVAIPSAGASGVALRARLLRKEGQYSVEASTFTLLLETIILTAAMATVGLLGLAYLIQRGQVGAVQISSFGALALGIAALLWSAWRLALHPQRSQNLLHKLGALWNRFFGRFKTIQPQVLDERLLTFQTCLGQLQYIPRWKYIFAAYARVALDVATLGACFMIFRNPVQPGTLFTGYGLILVASGMAALPGGLGLADASVPVIFSGLGVAGSVALAAGLTYRLIAFWLLRFIGFFSWQILESKHGRS